MATVRAARVLPGTIHEAEQRWYDTDLWAGWVDGLEEVESVEGEWPKPGARVQWRSGPAGRGRVSERVVEYEPRVGQTVEVEDQSITGRQRISFAAVEGGVQVELKLEYRIRHSSPITPVVDLLFIRRAMTRSLAQTLERF